MSSICTENVTEFRVIPELMNVVVASRNDERVASWTEYFTLSL